MPKTLQSLLTAAIALLLTGGAAASQPSADLETAVKATYLYKFAPFVTWPNSPGDSLTLCIIGTDPFGDVLDRAIAGQGYNGRPFRILRLPAVGTDSGCAVAYLGGSSDQSVASALKALKGAPVLTVTQNSQAPGMIDFVNQQGHVRFRVDLATASDSHLEISSKLLAMAVSVRDVSGGPQ
ncbi:YfiR family protein [Asticcacaulis sp.]|uniref:YfiR family protein n=1 Tax=Asticcacaulis sp. TaxID=1872648 RepID=UPI003F7C5469